MKQILDENNMLDAFFKSIDKHIITKSSKIINYNDDKIFSNTLKYNKNRKDLPFLSGIRKVNMSNKMFNILNETMSIDKAVLKKIKEVKMTIVRTSDPTRRKKLTIILDGVL